MSILDAGFAILSSAEEAHGATRRAAEITHVFGGDEAYEVIPRSQDDYRIRCGDLAALLTAALRT